MPYPWWEKIACHCWVLADSRRAVPFRSLGLDDRIFKAIQEAGYTEPTPIQAAAIPEVLAGRDVIGIAQTGTGKTAAFVLPILTKLAQPAGDGNRRGMKALIVAPTRELVVQIEENVRGLREASAAPHGHGLWRSERTSADRRPCARALRSWSRRRAD